ncbi:hypothetical protein LX32DRAFT_641445 [Colletotrichum zoysiae]|uniref:Uncharacterized protein n=1 Tax=Colletotrichum zoysiae TaxID=1216348 RepID=A0AAD9HES4_9PEZI|nr:hypothetical protein LX32DRAFT_641445 [Colletotrichum zoysiae]
MQGGVAVTFVLCTSKFSSSWSQTREAGTGDGDPPPSYTQFQSLSPVNVCQDIGARGMIDLLGRLAVARANQRSSWRIRGK